MGGKEQLCLTWASQKQISRKGAKAGRKTSAPLRLGARFSCLLDKKLAYKVRILPHSYLFPVLLALYTSLTPPGP